MGDGKKQQISDEVQCTTENIAVDVGLLFSQARLEQSLTVHDVAKALRIRRLYLEAIESGDLDVLPGHVYKIGFIRTYARFLKLDDEDLLRRLSLLTPPEPKPMVTPLRIPVEQQNRPSIYFAITLFFVAIGLAAAWWYPQFLNQEVEENIGVVPQPSIPTPTVVIDETPPVAQETPVAVETPVVTEELTPKPAPITIKVIASAWVHIVGENGETFLMRVMNPGEIIEIPDDQKYVMHTGNASGLRIAMGDLETKPLGEKGKVLRNVDLSPESFKGMLASNEP